MCNCDVVDAIASIYVIFSMKYYEIAPEVRRGQMTKPMLAMRRRLYHYCCITHVPKRVLLNQ